MVYTSISNDKIKEIKKLNNKKFQDLKHEFLIESEHLVKEAYKNNYLKLLIIEENSNFNLDVETIKVSKNILKYISETENPQNVMGVCRLLESKELKNKLLMLDDIQDPGNLGTIIRSAVAFNIDTIILSENTCSIYNPKVIRSSQGMIFNINFVKTNIKKFISDHKEYKYIGTKVTSGSSINNFKNEEKTCIIVGNEGSGVGKEILDLCDSYVYIPMSEKCESLNVGVATSILLYELNK